LRIRSFMAVGAGARGCELGAVGIAAMRLWAKEWFGPESDIQNRIPKWSLNSEASIMLAPVSAAPHATPPLLDRPIHNRFGLLALGSANVAECVMTITDGR
jgi:hypothetical protein